MGAFAKVQVALVVKTLPANTGDERDVGLIPGSGRSPGVRNGNPPQNSCLESLTDRGALAGYSPWGRRVGHDWAHVCVRLTHTHTHTCTHTHRSTYVLFRIFAFNEIGAYFPSTILIDLWYQGYLVLCGWAMVAQTKKNLPPMQETQVRSLGLKDPLE